MPLNYNGNTPAAVTHNGNPVSEVTYNGVTVWQAAPPFNGSVFTLAFSEGVAITLYYQQMDDYDVVVDWGDGSPPESAPTQGSAAYITHSYAAGDYTVRLTGEDWDPGGGALVMPLIYPYGTTYLTSAVLKGLSGSLPIGAFRGQNGLLLLDLPDNISYIGANAFNGCTSLTSITCRATTPPTVANANAFNNVPADCAIYVPSGSVAAYQAANIWSARAAYIQAIP